MKSKQWLNQPFPRIVSIMKNHCLSLPFQASIRTLCAVLVRRKKRFQFESPSCETRTAKELLSFFEVE
jgi:hypothetical protein